MANQVPEGWTLERAVRGIYSPDVPQDRAEREQLVREMTGQMMAGVAPDPRTAAGKRFHKKHELMRLLGMSGEKGAAWEDFYNRLQGMQGALSGLEEPGVKAPYEAEYSAAMDMDVSRAPELEAARAADMMAAQQQMGAVGMAREAAARGPEIARAQLQAQQNELAQQLAAQRAAGPMGARQALMGGASAGGQLARQGLGQMSQEALGRRTGALGAMGTARGGMLASAGLGTAGERQEDAYRHARATGAMGWLGMGQQRKEAERQAMLKLMGATTGQEQQAPSQPAWKPWVSGAANLMATALPLAAKAAGADTTGGGIKDPPVINPSQLKTPSWV